MNKQRLLALSFNFNLKFTIMKTVTMLHFRRNAEAVLRRIAKGERLVLSHRGKPAARLEPFAPTSDGGSADDPFVTVGARATASAKGKTKHRDIDRILYGSR